jgi:hypothetical protein
MRKRLTLSKETLRTLDERELSLVVGGSGSHDDKKKKKKTGAHTSCKAKSAKPSDSRC